LKIYIPHTKSYQTIDSEIDVIKYSEFFNSVDEAIVSFLLSWFDQSEIIKVQTSGSTGTPSIIELEKSAMRTSATLTLKRFNLSTDELMVNCLPVKFIAGKMMLVRAIVGRLKLKLVKPSNNPLKDFPKETIQFTALTPPQLESGIPSNLEEINRIETIIIGGAPITPSLQEKILAFHSNCYATYGMTETITHIAVQSLNNPAEDTFQVLEGIKLTTINDALVIDADHLKDSPIITTDIVSLSEDGRTFKWLGRKDYVINSGGIKLFPERIEKKIQPYLSCRIIVHQQSDAKFGAVPILIIEASSDIGFSLENIQLDKIETPRKIYYLDSFMETENGKINRLKTAELINLAI
jgi:O-succinylbenzoic acid--CoA ligase